MAAGRTLGWQHTKSTAFDLHRQGDSYRFSGHGSGHGVGLCVIGSARLAERGQRAAEILARYFPGLEISAYPGSEPTQSVRRARSEPAASARSVPAVALGPEVLVSLSDDDEGERAAIVRATARARDDLARTLGLPAPPRITLRFHPTTDDYVARCM